MSKQSPRHWGDYLDDDNHGGLVLYDCESPDHSPHEMYLYHFKTDRSLNHLKYKVKEHLRPLDEEELSHIES